MGVKRQVTEKVRQTVGRSADFEKTSKVRIQATYEELSSFAKELREYQKHQQEHIRSLRGFNQRTKHFLQVTKPRVHEEADNGASRALDAETRVGDFVNFDKLTTTTTEQEEAMYRTAQEPLSKWLVNYDAVAKSMKAMEKQRLQLDSRRRQHDKQGFKLDRMKSSRPADDPKMTKLSDTKKHKDVKLEQAEGEFRERERALYGDMQGLVADIQPVQLHVLQFYDFMRSLNDGIVKAFPKDMTGRLGSARSGGVTGAGQHGYDRAPVRTASMAGASGDVPGAAPPQPLKVPEADARVTGGVVTPALGKGERTPVATHAAAHAPPTAAV